ncbi:MAG: hypothetical protein RTV72_04465 [Candidatus Thorarchaeota archaeon]
MPKKKELRETTRPTTSEWLKEGRRTHDANILRQLISKSSSWKSITSSLNESLFEETYGLKPVPKGAVSLEILDRALSYKRVMDEITSEMRKVQPSGGTILEQIESLLPHGIPEAEVESISYAFGRIVFERIPKEVRWPIVPVGLDSLSAALLNLYIVAHAVKQKIPWMLTIWRLKIKEVKIDTLESIFDSLSRDMEKDFIIQTMKEADKSINDALGQDPKIDSFLLPQDPLSVKINKWLQTVSAKTADLKMLKTSIRKEVREIIADLKGYSAPLETMIDVHGSQVTKWEIMAIRSDGPPAHNHEPLLRLMRSEINILRYDLIRGMCINLKHVEQPGHPNVNDLGQVSEFAGRKAYYELQRVEPLLNECFVPTMRKLGLRYRYIFTPRQRPGVSSDGLIERMILTEQDIRGCTKHVEPTLSEGPNPRQFQKGSYEAVVEDEIVSLNLNHFNLESGDWYSKTQIDAPQVKQKDSLLIQRSTISDNKDPYKLSSRQVELLGLLWSLEGSQRKWFVDQVNYPQNTANRMLKELLDNQVLRLLYLPALEFSGLPDGLIAYANCSDRKSRGRFVDHIIESQPFARIYIGDSNDVIAHLRVPLKDSDHVAGDLKEKIADFSDQYFTARLRERKTYKITTLHKLRKPKTGEWIDPWRTAI